MVAATEVINRLQARGVTFQRGSLGGLRVTGVSRLSEQEKATLKAHKAAILRALDAPASPPLIEPTAEPVAAPATPIQAGLTPDEREDFEERAAIMEHDGGMTRTDAERAALARVQADRQAMPIVARVVDEFRRVFGPGIKVMYAEEAGRRLGTPPASAMDTPATHVPPADSRGYRAQETPHAAG